MSQLSNGDWLALVYAQNVADERDRQCERRATDLRVGFALSMKSGMILSSIAKLGSAEPTGASGSLAVIVFSLSVSSNSVVLWIRSAERARQPCPGAHAAGENASRSQASRT